MFFVFPWPPTQLRDRPNIAADFKGGGVSPGLVFLLGLASASIHYSFFPVLIAT